MQLGEDAAVVAHDAAGGEARHGVVRVGAQGEVALVVAQDDVEARAVLLDEGALGEECLGFVADRDDFEVGDAVDHAAQFRGGVTQGGGTEIALHAAAQRDGFADVDDGALAVAHQVATGLVGQRGEFFA